ncbi:hypothetical protein [uncultured Vagococcus sp.]|uniref:hypothetical protein n=1 Tax=uncultured Vagococcus sp. TaxID=189676 RepID=UPI0028D90219|nr:hypothetical protein [uncultured Vagococcus sp.]
MIKNEKGYTLAFVLIFSLFISLLAFVILSAVLSTSAQIKKVDQHQKKLDIGELAIQDAKLQLAELIYDEISPESGEVKSFGENEVKLTALMNKIRTKWNTTLSGEHPLSSSSTPSYKMEIEPISVGKTQAKGYDQVNISDEKALEDNIYAYRTTFPLRISVVSEEGELKKLTCDYNYSLQWVSKKAGEIAVQADYWASNFKAIDVNRGFRFSNPNYISRTFLNLMESQKETGYYQDLKLTNLPPGIVSDQIYGKRGEYLVDYGDKNKVADFSKLNRVGTNNTFVGSLIFEKGVSLLGDSTVMPTASLDIYNVLKLSNLNEGSTTENYVKDITLNAGSGIYIGLNPRENELNSGGQIADLNGDGIKATVKPNSRLVVDNSDKNIITSPNFWVNGAINNQKSDESGLILGRGVVQVKETLNKVNLDEYRPSSVFGPILKGEQWNKLQHSEGGSLMITNSLVTLGPAEYKVNGITSKTNLTDTRQINVEGNFLLSNMHYRILSNDIDGKYLSNLLSNKRSVLILDGKNTSLNVKGVTHIDAPKHNKKKVLTNQLVEPNFATENYIAFSSTVPKGFDGQVLIQLKNQSRIQLGYTSVEPFELAMENNTVFRMKVVPNVLFFDTTFLKDWKAKGSNGKIVLEVGSSSDLTKVKKLLTDLGVSSNTVNQSTGTYDDSAASNGKVTLVYSNTGNQDTLQYINRTSAFIENIKY